MRLCGHVLLVASDSETVAPLSLFTERRQMPSCEFLCVACCMTGFSFDSENNRLILICDFTLYS